MMSQKMPRPALLQVNLSILTIIIKSYNSIKAEYARLVWKGAIRVRAITSTYILNNRKWQGIKMLLASVNDNLTCTTEIVIR